MPRIRLGVLFAVAIGLACATTSFAARAQQQQPAASQAYDPHLGDGFILGTVVETVTGQPVPGAIVSIAYGGPVTNAVQLTLAPQPPGVPPDVPRRVLTDVQGHFFFKQLGAGRYRASVTAPGYLPGGYLQLKPGGTVHYIDLDDSAKRTEIVMRLWKCGAISGTVLDEGGEPAVGAEVRVIERSMSGGISQLLPVLSATTDDRGVYRASGLGPGPFIVGVVVRAASASASIADSYAMAQFAAGPSPNPGAAPPPAIAGLRIGDSIFALDGNSSGLTIPPPTPDGKVAVYATTFFPSATSSGEATPITLHSGEEREGVNLSLTLTPTVRVSGTVIGANGPVPAAAVALTPQTPSPFAMDLNTSSVATLTDQSGVFSLIGVAPGTYVLKTITEPGAAARVGMSAAPPSKDPILWAITPLTVASTDVTGVTLTMRTGLRARGQIEFEGTKNKPTPEQIAMTRVTLVPAALRLGVPVPAAVADPTGQFTTSAYPPGPYFVTATIPGWTVKSVMLGSKDVADEPLDLETNDIEGLTIVFTDQTATDQRPGRLLRRDRRLGYHGRVDRISSRHRCVERSAI